MPDFYLRTRCRMCNGSNLQKVMSLTPTPPGNNFLRECDLLHSEPCYPLDLYFCHGCHHVQLGHVVDPKILYQDDYRYVSGTSAQFVRHLHDYAKYVMQRFDLKAGDFVVDIGSNDGTCLRAFQNEGLKVLGIDPATEIAQQATRSGIQTIAEFFSGELAVDLRKKFGPATFITSHNACAHIDHLDDVIRGVRHLLADDGVFVLEVGYLLDVYTNIWFDTIYHEHLDYHTVEPFVKLFARLDMEMLGVERISPQGGSIRIFAQRSGGLRQADNTAAALISLEHASGLDKPDTFVTFGHRIKTIGRSLKTLIEDLKSSGKTIAGYGAATKSTTLLSHFGLNQNDLDFIVDDNPLKQGRFSPANHIPVVSSEELYRRQPDYLLILAWNFADPIIAAHQEFTRRGGRFILPMPTPCILQP